MDLTTNVSERILRLLVIGHSATPLLKSHESYPAVIKPRSQGLSSSPPSSRTSEEEIPGKKDLTVTEYTN